MNTLLTHVTAPAPASRSHSLKSPCRSASPADGHAFGPALSTCPRERHQVLVVDDNRDAADSLAQLFVIMGANVSVAYGAQEALIAMTVGHHRIAFIDIGMPVMNGYELAAQIRASDTFAGVILIALTGWDQASEANCRATTGFDHHLVKPADPEQLNALLASIPVPRAL